MKSRAGGWAVDQYYYDYYSGSYYSVQERERERELLVVASHRYTHTHTHVYTYYMPCCLSSLRAAFRQMSKRRRRKRAEMRDWRWGDSALGLWVREGGGFWVGISRGTFCGATLQWAVVYTYIETRRRSTSRVSWAGGIILYGVCQSDEKSATVTMKLPTDLTLRSGSNNNDNSQFSHNHNHKFRTCPAIV